MLASSRILYSIDVSLSTLVVRVTLVAGRCRDARLRLVLARLPLHDIWTLL